MNLSVYLNGRVLNGRFEISMNPDLHDWVKFNWPDDNLSSGRLHGWECSKCKTIRHGKKKPPDDELELGISDYYTCAEWQIQNIHES